MLFGSHAVIFGLTLVYSQNKSSNAVGWKIYLRRICLECTTTHGWIGPVFWYLPFPNTCAKDWILSGRLVHHIWNPSVPPGLKLRSVLYSLEPAVQHSAEPLLTLRTPESPLCNPPILSVLWYHKPLAFCAFLVKTYRAIRPPSSRNICCRTDPFQLRCQLWCHLYHIVSSSFP